MRPKNIHAVATRSSIASLWAMAETHNTVQILLPSYSACLNIRNKLYAHRAALRRQAAALVGIEASHLDAFKFTFSLLEHDTEHPGKWLFTISYEVEVEFELILPDNITEEELSEYSFDTPLQYDDVVSTIGLDTDL